jgi:predicted nucleotidyltransferase
MTDKRLQTILVALKKGLQKLYGPRLKGLVLYGSYARGEASLDSDIDVAVVLDGYGDVWTEIRCYGGLVQRLCLRFNVLIALFVVGEAEWSSRQSPILINIRQEGVPL